MHFQITCSMTSESVVLLTAFHVPDIVFLCGVQFFKLFVLECSVVAKCSSAPDEGQPTHTGPGSGHCGVAGRVQGSCQAP